MTSTPYGPVTRRAVGALILGAAAAPAFAAGKLAPKAHIVTMLGDSITAGYGLPARDALPARLEAGLAKLAPGTRVRAAGVSGDTSAGGAARVDFSVQKDTAVCIVALGGNDLLQGLDPKQTRANLDRIIRRLKARGITVVLAGLTAPNAIGRGYAREFGAVFPALAKQYGLALYPNLLEGVAGNPKLNQRDGIHPNAMGAAIIAGKLAPVVAMALATRR